MREFGPTDPIRILLLSDKVDHASTDLRGMGPLAVLEEARLAVVGLHSIGEVVDDKNPSFVDPESKDSRIRDFARDIDLCDLIVVVQTGATAWGKFIEDWRKMGKVVVMDVDDDIRHVSPLSPVYATRGTEEVWITAETLDGKKRVQLWKDGQKVAPELGKDSPIFDMKLNRMWQGIVMGGLSKADAVTCPTERFAETIRREINPVAYALPNSLDLELWRPGRVPESARPGFRVCWYGGDSHRMDVGAAAEGLKRFMVGKKDVTFVLVGANLTEWLAAVPPEQLEYWPWNSYDAHPWRLMSLGIDVGLCPVIGHKFNHAKSPLKWTELGACGVPSICSDSPPYCDAVKNGEDGFLVPNDAEAWEKALNTLYFSDEKRRRVGAAARERMERDFDIYRTASQWNRVYRELLEKRRQREIVIPEEVSVGGN